jgi:hypothetical protein
MKSNMKKKAKRAKGKSLAQRVREAKVRKALRQVPLDQMSSIEEEQLRTICMMEMDFGNQAAAFLRQGEPLKQIEPAWGEIQRRLDQLVTQNQQAKNLVPACRPGCAKCCTLAVVLSIPELARIHFALKDISPELRKRVREIAAAYADNPYVYDDQAWARLNLPCPLLDVNSGKCLTYAARRLFAVGGFRWIRHFVAMRMEMRPLMGWPNLFGEQYPRVCLGQLLCRLGRLPRYADSCASFSFENPGCLDAWARKTTKYFCRYRCRDHGGR